MIQMPPAWADDNPFFLLIVHYPELTRPIPVVIDTGVPDWASEHHDLMRTAPAKWFLVLKAASRAVAALVVNPGDQPFYRARHVGTTMPVREITAYGLGKKNADGSEQSVWLLPNGMVCGGDDVFEFGIDLVSQMGPPQEAHA